MKKMNKNTLSALTVILFFILAAASKINKIHTGAFNESAAVEDSSDSRTYLLKNDGTKIYGEKIGYQNGLLLKRTIAIDDKKFKIPEIKGFKRGNAFYGRFGSDYIKRIVHGKLNVYYIETTSFQTSNATYIIHTAVHTYFYVQRGDDGELTALANQKDIKKAVSGCPLSEEMADKSSSGIRRAIRANRNYLNNIFEIYNNDCKALK